MKTNPDFVFRNIYGKMILMPVRRNEASNDPVFFNRIAGDIWKLAEKNMPFEKIIAIIDEQYNLQPGSIEEDSVKCFIAEMVARKLLLE